MLRPIFSVASPEKIRLGELHLFVVAETLHLSELVVVYRVDCTLAKIGLDLIANGIGPFDLDARRFSVESALVQNVIAPEANQIHSVAD